MVELFPYNTKLISFAFSSKKETSQLPSFSFGKFIQETISSFFRFLITLPLHPFATIYLFKITSNRETIALSKKEESNTDTSFNSEATAIFEGEELDCVLRNETITSFNSEATAIFEGKELDCALRNETITSFNSEATAIFEGKELDCVLRNETILGFERMKQDFNALWETFKVDELPASSNEEEAPLEVLKDLCWVLYAKKYWETEDSASFQIFFSIFQKSKSPLLTTEEQEKIKNYITKEIPITSVFLKPLSVSNKSQDILATTVSS